MRFRYNPNTNITVIFGFICEKIRTVQNPAIVRNKILRIKQMFVALHSVIK